MRVLRILLISVLIALSSSYILMSLSIYTSPDAVMTGSDLMEEVFIAIGLGLAIGLLSFIFDVERIPFFVQLVLHFTAIMLLVFTAGYFGHWYDISNISTVMTVFVSILVIYGLTWLIIRILTKKDIDELNQKIQKRRGESR